MTQKTVAEKCFETEAPVRARQVDYWARTVKLALMFEPSSKRDFVRAHTPKSATNASLETLSLPSLRDSTETFLKEIMDAGQVCAVRSLSFPFAKLNPQATTRYERIIYFNTTGGRKFAVEGIWDEPKGRTDFSKCESLTLYSETSLTIIEKHCRAFSTAATIVIRAKNYERKSNGVEESSVFLNKHLSDIFGPQILARSFSRHLSVLSERIPWTFATLASVVPAAALYAASPTTKPFGVLLYVISGMIKMAQSGTKKLPILLDHYLDSQPAERSPVVDKIFKILLTKHTIPLNRTQRCLKFVDDPY